MRFKHGIVAVAIVASFAAFAPSAMAAARFTSTSTASGQSFQGVNVGNHVFKIGTNFTTTCTGATYTGTTPTPTSGGPTPVTLAWNSLSFAPAYTGCSTRVAGVNYATTVSCTGNWTIDGGLATFTPSTGATTGGRITIPSGSSCTIAVTSTSCSVTAGPQTVSNGITGQNRNAADTADVGSSGTPGASRLFANSTGISRSATAGCSSIGGPTGSAADAQYTGNVAIKPLTSPTRIGIWVKL